MTLHMKVPDSWFKIFVTRSTFLSNSFHKQNAKTAATNDPNNLTMEFEYGPKKSQINAKKQGIDFESAKRLWADEKRLVIEAPYPVESRYTMSNVE